MIPFEQIGASLVPSSEDDPGLHFREFIFKKIKLIRIRIQQRHRQRQTDGRLVDLPWHNWLKQNNNPSSWLSDSSYFSVNGLDRDRIKTNVLGKWLSRKSDVKK